MALRVDPTPAPAAGAETSTDSRVRRFVASTETVDSYNTVIKADGWKLDRYARNPVVLLQHASRSFPIGMGKASVENGQLMLDVEFAPADDPVSGPEAEQALRWVDRGVMGVSVGFQPLEETYNEGRETGDAMKDLFSPPIDYTSVELFEVSVVSVPANPDALLVGRSAAAARYLERMKKREDAPAQEPAKTEPPAEEPKAADMTCPECGASCAPGAKFCADCGTALTEKADEAKAVLGLVSREQFTRMVERITAEERSAAAARRRGKTSRRNP